MAERSGAPRSGWSRRLWGWFASTPRRLLGPLERPWLWALLWIGCGLCLDRPWVVVFGCGLMVGWIFLASIRAVRAVFSFSLLIVGMMLEHQLALDARFSLLDDRARRDARELLKSIHGWTK